MQAMTLIRPNPLIAAPSMNALTIGLCVGLCVLSVLLLILSRSKWGSERTTHKCIWLSVFAHILLVVYASQTQLLSFGNASGESEVNVPVTIVVDMAELADDEVRIELAESMPQSPPVVDLQAPDLLPDESNDQQAQTSPDADDLVSEHPRSSDSVPSGGNQTPITSTDVAAPELLEKNTESPIAEPAAGSPAVSLGRPKELELETPASSAITSSAQESNDADAPQFIPPSDAQVQNAAPNPNAPRPEIYALRSANNRLEVAQAHGGNEQTEAAVREALAWLVANQEADGRWDPRKTEAGREFRVLGHDRRGAGGDADTAMTGLALLALMGAGYDHLQGEYRDSVRRGLQFILQSQKRSGHLAGDASLFAHMYSHGIATLAVGEAYALTGDERLKPALERAVAYSLGAQDSRTGGWRYQPGEEGDMSQFGWQVMALKSAQLGGISIPRPTVQRMHGFVDLCSSGTHGGWASYRPRQPPSATMTAEALCCRYFLGQSVSTRTSDEAASLIARFPPGSGETDYYLWYYATIALYQKGGTDWDRWNQSLQTQLLSTQTKHGAQAGSWEPNGKWCGYGGRVFSTALATMCLEVYYRYLPFMREQVAWGDTTPQR